VDGVGSWSSVGFHTAFGLLVPPAQPVLTIPNLATWVTHMTHADRTRCKNCGKLMLPNATCCCKDAVVSWELAVRAKQIELLIQPTSS